MSQILDTKWHRTGMVYKPKIGIACSSAVIDITMKTQQGLHLRYNVAKNIDKCTCITSMIITIISNLLSNNTIKLFYKSIIQIHGKADLITCQTFNGLSGPWIMWMDRRLRFHRSKYTYDVHINIHICTYPYMYTYT